MDQGDEVNEKLETEFHNAIDICSIRLALKCINEGVNVNRIYQHGQSVLHLMAKRNKHILMGALLSHCQSFDLNIRTHHGRTTPLMLAAQYGSNEANLELLRHGADPNLIDDKDRGALHYATYIGNETIIFDLISYNTNTMNTDIFDNTPLTYATVYKQNLKVCSLLLQLVELPRKLGPVFLENVLHCNNSVRVKITMTFVSYGVDINYRDRRSGKTCLHIVAATNYFPLALQLLENGADKTLKDVANRLPVHVAQDHGNTDLVFMLSSKKIYRHKPPGRESTLMWQTPHLAERYFMKKRILQQLSSGPYLDEPESFSITDSDTTTISSID